MRTPLLSVTVTNYNYQRFLESNVESILSQTFSDFELLIIDNASTDGSQELIRQLAAKEERIRPVLHRENIGALASFREACDLSRGKYRVHIDADDWVISPQAFERQVDLLEKHPTMSFVFSALTMVGDSDSTKSVHHPFDRDVVLPGERALEPVLSFSLGHIGMMHRLDYYRQCGGYPSGFRYYDDMLLAVRLCELGEVGYIDDELYASRQHGSNEHRTPELGVVRHELLPIIDIAFSGPLGGKFPDTRVRRRLERNALVHHATYHIFEGRLKGGWTLYWESVKCRPLATLFRPRTVSLVARSILGARLFNVLYARPLSSVRDSAKAFPSGRHRVAG